jgi:hypothetical protein
MNFVIDDRMSSHVRDGLYTCPKKLEARYQTVIDLYRREIGVRFPDEKQYWTLCARCIDDDGRIISNCELDQMLKAGLISSPDQFHGVDWQQHLYEANLKSKIGGHWYTGQFINQMIRACNEREFNPGVVNMDSLRMSNRGSVEFCQIMRFLGEVPNLKNVLLVGNFILRQRKEIRTPFSIFEDIKRSIDPSKWDSDYRVYVYEGSGTSHWTVMGSVVFWLK